MPGRLGIAERHLADPFIHHPYANDVGRIGRLGFGQIDLECIRDRRPNRPHPRAEHELFPKFLLARRHQV
jgi:hypothetical protein